MLSRHTTTALAINEAESRLLDDIRQWLARMAPPGDPYLHNDLALRRGPDGWPGGDEAWRAQEPVNAHSLRMRALKQSPRLKRPPNICSALFALLRKNNRRTTELRCSFRKSIGDRAR